MWRRLRRKTMAPRRPAVWPGQYALALVTAIVLGCSIGLVIWAFWG